MLVPKADGIYHFCIDFRKVNAITKSDSFLLPRVEDYIDYIGNSWYISKFGLLKGYWQVQRRYLLLLLLIVCISILSCHLE